MVKRVEERRYDVVADVVVAERGELLAHGVDGDARGVADHRYDTPGVDGVAVCTSDVRARENEDVAAVPRESRNGHAAASAIANSHDELLNGKYSSITNTNYSRDCL